MVCQGKAGDDGGESGWVLSRVRYAPELALRRGVVGSEALGGQDRHRARPRPTRLIRAECRAEEIDWPLVCGITLTKIAIAAIGKIGISDCRSLASCRGH